MKKIILMTVMILFCLMSAAQDIQGIKSYMTKEDVIALFGEPQNYKRNHICNESEDHLYEDYYYEKDTQIQFFNGDLNEYDIRSDRFIMFPSLFPGGVKIGDSFSKVQSKYECFESQDNKGLYWSYLAGSDSKVRFRVDENGVITYIGCQYLW